MNLSVILPTHNRPASMRRALEALLPQFGGTGVEEAEAIVVDDASDPRAQQAMEEDIRRLAHPGLCFVTRTVRGGPGAARNEGVRHARGEILAFLDDDCVPESSYVGAILRTHHEHREVLVLNGHLEPLRMHRYAAFWQYYYDRTFSGEGEIYPVPRVASGHFSIKRRLLERVEPLFDEGLPSREDYDLYLRLRALGVGVWKTDAVRGLIECRGSLAALLRQRAWYAEGERLVRAKHGTARIAEEQRAHLVPPSRRFLLINLALRVQREFLLRRRPRSAPGRSS